MMTWAAGRCRCRSGPMIANNTGVADSTEPTNAGSAYRVAATKHTVKPAMPMAPSSAIRGRSTIRGRARRRRPVAPRTNSRTTDAARYRRPWPTSSGIRSTVAATGAAVPIRNSDPAAVAGPTSRSTGRVLGTQVLDTQVVLVMGPAWCEQAISTSNSSANQR